MCLRFSHHCSWHSGRNSSACLPPVPMLRATSLLSASSATQSFVRSSAMQSSTSASEDTASTKAALDYLQQLIEQLLRENRDLRLSLQQTRSRLDEVRDNLNRFKLQVAENERNDRVIRRQIRAMATLIQRRREDNSPPSSPEMHPVQSPPSTSKTPSSPNHPRHDHIPADTANIQEVTSIPRSKPTRDIPSLPNINGNRPETVSNDEAAIVSYIDSRAISAEKITQEASNSSSSIGDTRTKSRSLSAEDPSERISSPSTSVSDALQKAFVAMEKDTTNSVQVLHDTKHSVSLQGVADGKHRGNSDSRSCPSEDTSQDVNTHNANGMQQDGPHPYWKQRLGSSRKRAMKALRRNGAGLSPLSDTAVSLSSTRAPKNGANGKLKRSLTQVKSATSRSEPKKRMAKTVALKRTKKGYKVSLGLSRNSSRSGSSSSSSDSSSDSNGPGCSASFSHSSGPAKAQVSLDGGLSELIGAARKLKGNLGRRKEKTPEDDGPHNGESGASASDGSSNAKGNENGGKGIQNGTVAANTAIVASAATLYTVNHSEGKHDALPFPTGSPKLDGYAKVEEKDDLEGAFVANQGHTVNRTNWQHLGQSNPFTDENTHHMENVLCTTGVPHNPVPESAKNLSTHRSELFHDQMTERLGDHDLQNHPHTAASESQSPKEDSSDEQSLAAGKATENDNIETPALSESPTIHEITHVPVKPLSFRPEKMSDNPTTSSNMKPCVGGTTEFLTVRASSSDMLLWKARPGSRYVDVSKGALAVKHPAAVSFEDGKVVMNGKMRILKPVRVTSTGTDYYYVSPLYPDGTFLPYVPVSGVVLHGRPVHWDSSRYADQSVQLSFSKEVFDTLVSFARRAYRKKYPRAQVNFPGAFLSGHRVRKVVRIEPGCSVNMTRLRKAPMKSSVAETLATVKKDVIGLVLLYLSIEAKDDDPLSVEVIFGFHSMVAHRLSSDRRR